MSDDVAELKARISELESEGKSLTRESISHKKGYQGLKAFLESKGIDPQGDLEEQWQNTSGKAKTEVDVLTKRLDKISAQLERAEKEKAELSEQATYSKIRTELSDKMKDIIGNDELIDLWIAKKKIKIDGNKPIYDDDGDEITMDKAVEKYRKTHPERVKISQSSGAGSSSTSSSGQSGSKDKNKMSSKDFSGLNRKDRDAFVLGGGQVIDDRSQQGVYPIE
jgi:chromosome segregation ATPase